MFFNTKLNPFTLIAGPIIKGIEKWIIKNLLLQLVGQVASSSLFFIQRRQCGAKIKSVYCAGGFR